MQGRNIKRKCLVCGRQINLFLYKNGKYSAGHYFGKLKPPIKGTGEYKKIAMTKIGTKKYPVVKWTGKEKELEYWECDKCFDEAMHEQWLEERIRKLFGKRCPDYYSGCLVCEAWSIYDTIRELRDE
ncbi:MAG: hypothetical protein J4415_01655 [Candidatus Diapherotrites archaeon]|uniref:Uncharacterized protein n=1 Tax=Candidatus Iainarchaeum sp. TaxID=3101447 RepID=A0A8T4KQL8_9ARCH|nr:hypothetical protein [Candidatus Diapherotrites archaeon]